MTTITDVAEAMQTLLTVTANRVGRDSGFIQRERVLTGASFAQTVVFGWLSNPTSTRAELHQTAATVGVTISAPGLDKRFTGRAAEFLRQLLGEALALGGEQLGSVRQRFPAIHVRDTTQVTLPPGLAAHWPGSGNQPGQPNASLKVGLDWEVTEGRLCGLTLTAGRVHDQSCGLQRGVAETGALYLQDLGFFDLQTLAQYDQQQNYFITRLKVGTHLYTPAGKAGTRVLLPQDLRARTSATVDEPMEVGQQQRLRCRLIAQRVPATVAQERRRQLRQQAKRKGQAVSADRLALADWSVFITNLPTSVSVEDVMQIVRWRWQIELVFKLWKSDGLLDEWRTAQPERVLCEVYGKLLALVVQHWLLLLRPFAPLRYSLVQAAQVIRKSAFHLAHTLPDWDALRLALNQVASTLAGSGRRSRRQRHPLAFQFWQACFG